MMSTTLDRFRGHAALPVLMKEMRSRMRGLRSPILLFITTGLAILLCLLIISPEWDSIGNVTADGVQNMANLGRHLFIGVVILEALLCALLAPSLTAGAIALEREQQTLDLLLLTPLSSMNILMGKLLSSLSLSGMVLLCVLPITAISFLLGGVDPAQFCWSFLLILATMFLFGTLGLCCSVRYPRTSASAAVAYLLALLWLTLLPIFMGLFELFQGYQADEKNLHLSFIVFSVMFSGILALIPTAVTSAAVTGLFRREFSRVSAVAVWFIFSAALSTLLLGWREECHQLIQNDPITLMLGNPVVAMISMFANDSLGRTTPTFSDKFFIPLTIGIELLGTWVILTLTVGALNRLRR